MFDMIVITVRRGVPVGADTDAYKGFFTLPAQLVPSADRSPEHSISPVRGWRKLCWGSAIDGGWHPLGAVR